MVGNGVCNDKTNNAECFYDGGDCCTLDCLDCTCYHEDVCKTGLDYHPLVGDGYCNDETNNAVCGFDGGDCCGTCVNEDYCSNCECLVQGKIIIDA